MDKTYTGVLYLKYTENRCSMSAKVWSTGVVA